MNIMFCIMCLSYGGAEKNLCMVANEMVSRGHSVSIVNFNTLPTVQKIDPKITVFDVPKFEKKGVKRIQQIRYMSDLVKDTKPDVIVSFLFIENALSSIVGKLTGVPVIVSERGDPYTHTDLISKIIYKIYSLSTGAVFQTEGAREYFGKKMQKKSVVIPNPISIKSFPERTITRKSIAFAARFVVHQKRQDLMVEAFSIVHDQFPEYVLDFYGDGPDETTIKQLVCEKQLSDSVVFHGASKNVLQDISESEIFVLSSDFEGIPNSLLEALAIGMPCVATDCTPGGARMLINNGVNGTIVKLNDAKELASGIIELIQKPELREKYSKNAKKVVDTFDKKKILDMWEIYLKKVANKKNDKKID